MALRPQGQTRQVIGLEAEEDMCVAFERLLFRYRSNTGATAETTSHKQLLTVHLSHRLHVFEQKANANGHVLKATSFLHSAI